MELRTLRYFLAVAEEGSITNASKRLHLTQPTLSRQLADLEKELGRQLFTRRKTGIELTEYGTMLAEYAASITALADKAESDIKLPSQSVSGRVHIGAGETKAMRFLAQAMLQTRQQYPGVDFQIHSGTSLDLMDGLVRGQYDFLLECEVQPHAGMHVLKLPDPDLWGAIVTKDDPIAQQERVRIQDVIKRPLIVSRQALKAGAFHEWLGDDADHLNVVATYSLIMNTKWLIRANVGIALGYDDLLTIEEDTDLVFIPLEPHTESQHGLVWRKTLLTRQAQVFLDELQKVLKEEELRSTKP